MLLCIRVCHRLRLLRIADAFIFQEVDHQPQPQYSAQQVKQAEQAVAPQLISMFAELNADGEDQHLQHSHRRRDRAFAHLAGEQR